LVLREFIYTIYHKKETALPLREEILFVKVKDPYEVDSGKTCF